MAEPGTDKKALPHELVDRFADEVAPTGFVGGGSDGRWLGGESSGLIGGRMVRVLIEYADEGP